MHTIVINNTYSNINGSSGSSLHYSSLLNSTYPGGYQRLEEEGVILQLVFDVTSENIHESIDLSKEHIINIERITQSLYFALHSERANKINSG